MKKLTFFSFLTFILLFISSCGKTKPIEVIETIESPSISISEDSLVWSLVSSAKGYEIYINDSIVATVTNTSYSLLDLSEGTYTIYVIAYNDSLKSEKSNEVTYNKVVSHEKLLTPVISISGKVVSWFGVNDATGYDVYVNDVYTVRETSLSYTLNVTLSGEYKVYIKAVVDGDELRTSDASNTVTYTYIHEILSAPAISLNDNIVSWDRVLHATAYKVWVNGTELQTSNTTYPINANESGTYEVKVCALGDNKEYFDSIYSNTVTYVKNKDYITTSYNLNSYSSSTAFVNQNNQFTSNYTLGNLTLLTLGSVVQDSPLTLSNGTVLNNCYNSLGLYNGSNYGIRFSVSSAASIKVYYKSDSTAPIIYTNTGELESFATSSDSSSGTMFVREAGTYVLSGSSDCYIYGFDVTIAEDSIDDITLTNSGNVISLSKSASVLVKREVNENTNYYFYSDISSINLNTLGAGTYTLYAYSSSVLENYVQTTKYIETVVYEKLSAPILTQSGNRLFWALIPNATQYEVYYNGVLRDTVVDGTYTFNESAGSYDITVKAISSDKAYTTSDASNVITKVVLPTLNAPVPTLEDDRLTWVEVENASSYTVMINRIEYVVTDLFYILPTETGYYEIQVKANGIENEYNDSIYSDTYAFSKQGQISTPVLTLSDNVVSWNIVTSATQYEVYINDELEDTINSTSYTLDVLPGTYNIYVIAKGDGEAYLDSEVSNIVSYTLLERLVAPVVSISGTSITWAQVSGAQSYDIYYDEEFIFNTSSLSYNLDSYNIAGYYYFNVVAKGDNVTFRDSLMSLEVEYIFSEKLAKPTIAVVDNVISITSVENADSYNIYLNGVRLDNTKNVSYTINFPSNGEYELCVTALSNNDEIYLESNISNVFIVKVSGVETKVSEGNINFNGNSSGVSTLSNATYTVSDANSSRTINLEYEGVMYTTGYNLTSNKTISLTIDYKSYVTITYYAVSLGGGIKVGTLTSGQINTTGFGSYKYLVNAGTHSISNVTKSFGILKIEITPFDEGSSYEYDVTLFSDYKSTKLSSLIASYDDSYYTESLYTVLNQKYTNGFNKVNDSLTLREFNTNYDELSDLLDDVKTISNNDFILSLIDEIDVTLYEGETLASLNTLISEAKAKVSNSLSNIEIETIYDDLIDDISNL